MDVEFGLYRGEQGKTTREVKRGAPHVPELPRRDETCPDVGDVGGREVDFMVVHGATAVVAGEVEIRVVDEVYRGDFGSTAARERNPESAREGYPIGTIASTRTSTRTSTGDDGDTRTDTGYCLI